MCKITDGIVFILLGIAGVVDWRKREIPMWLLAIMSVLILCFAVCCKNVGIWYRLAGVAFGIMFFVISKVTKEAVGYGDSWMILLLGAHLGILRALQVLFASSLISAVYALFYLWKHRWDKKATLPFVSFLAMAYIGVLFV